MTEKSRVPAGVEVRKPHAARVYDYALGGKDNYAADRALIDKLTGVIPDTPLAARENRAFLGRAVHFLAEAGIRQFLDIGTGLRAPRGAGSPSGMKGPPTDTAVDVRSRGQSKPGGAGEDGSSPDNVGTGRHHQTARARKQGGKVQKTNQCWKPLDVPTAQI